MKVIDIAGSLVAAAISAHTCCAKQKQLLLHLVKHGCANREN